MTKIAVYPGSFDPVTLGHMDVISRSLKFVDQLVVAVGNNPSKKYYFSAKERYQLIGESIKENIDSLLLSKVSVEYMEGLLADFVKNIQASLIIRGVRIFSDFDYEFNLARVNSKLYPQVETIFLITAEDKQFISSSFVKEIALYKGDVSNFVSPCVIKAFSQKAK